MATLVFHSVMPINLIYHYVIVLNDVSYVSLV